MGAKSKNNPIPNGFTILEVMLTLLLVAIIVAIGAPSFRQFSLNARITGAANDLVTALQQTRSEAVKRQQVVALCASADPEAATPSCDAAFGGWVVWQDTNNDGAVAAGEPIVSRHPVLPTELTVTTDGSFVSYDTKGFAQRTVNGANGMRLLLLCDERGNQTVGDQTRRRVLSVSVTGRPAVLKAVDTIAALDALDDTDLDLQCQEGT